MSKLAYTAIALIFALAATAANAQTPQPVPPAAAPGPAAKILPSMPSEAMTVTHWYKQNVYDPSDAKIGEIMDVLVDRGGKIVALVVGAVQYKTKENNKWYPVMNTTKDALKNAPGYKYDHTAMTWVPENSPATTGSPTPAPRSNAR